MEEKLSKRQIQILNLLSQKDLARSEIEKYLETTYSVSKATIVRDLTDLISLRFIEQKGSGPSTYYTIKNLPYDLPIFDLDDYFKSETDKRKILGERFNSDLINKVDTFFSGEELATLENTKTSFAKRINSKNDTEIKKELERFVIELSWKSSQIEGNTYTLLDTENLLKNNIEALNHSQQEKQMILDHKYAFDYIIKNTSEFKDFTAKGLDIIHSLIVKSLGVSLGFRTHGVGISGTKYLPLDNKYQIEDAITKLEKKLKKTKSPFIKAFGTLLFISYIQPFADGNKRTARMLSNAILFSNNCYPLSYRSVDETYYKKAQILFYEQYNIFYFKQIFKEQYNFSLDNYFI
jgi:Fic family protein